MKFLNLFLLLALFLPAKAQEADGRIVLVPVEKTPVPVPLFFSVDASVTSTVGFESITGSHQLNFKIHQGKPELLSLPITGSGDITTVTGEGLRDWAVRTDAEGNRFLELRPTQTDGIFPAALTVVATTLTKATPGAISLPLPAPGNATGFNLNLQITADPTLDLRITRADGFSAVGDPNERRFIAKSAAILEIETSTAGSSSRGLDWINASVTGKLSADGKSVSFQLTGNARAREAGATLDLLGNGAALSGNVSGENWHIDLVQVASLPVYQLVAAEPGEFPVSIDFEVPVSRRGDWHTLDFSLNGGAVVPITLEGLAKGVSFDRSLPVVPNRTDTTWRGFVPANGRSQLAWHLKDEIGEGALFFSSSETTDTRIGSGLLRQSTQLDLRVLQGKLPTLNIAIAGPGEVLAVRGEVVIGWSVSEVDDMRQLEIRLNRPIEGETSITIESQAALGTFPVRTEAMRLSPVGALRHSGWLRIANEGAVRIEVADATGLIQLTPAQFPAGVDESLRQVYVYRFPSADRSYAILADQVLPEISVTEVTVYELAEADRRVFSDIELDIREAPLREWDLEIPEDHAVASVTGASVADYVVASQSSNGNKKLKILFREPVSGRQLISLRLERNQSAKPGEWTLSPLGFPGAKSRRGYIGAVAAAGYRLTAGKLTGVAEVPVTFFPKSTPGLQQAFRLREENWTITLSVEALGQSIQADVFHLYSLKTNAVYGSVLLNYFVIGAPATEWKISIPEGLGNIDVTGQSVGRDWRIEKNTLIIPLSRPVLGAGTVLVTFEQPISSTASTISPGEVRPLEVQDERGYVQVVSPLQINHEVTTSTGPLLALDPSELPSEFRLLSSAPTLGAWQYTGRDFSIAMKIDSFTPGETADQVVDFLKLSTQISRDGQWVTDARFYIKSKGTGVLRMSLPGSPVLWEAKVAGEPVNARKDGKDILLPLPPSLDPNQSVEVTLRYGARSKDSNKNHLTAPKLSAPVVIGEWAVTGDPGRRLIPAGGTAQLVKPVVAEDATYWISRNARLGWGILLATLISLVAGWKLPTRKGGLRRFISVLAGLTTLALSIVAALNAFATARPHSGLLEYSAPVVLTDGEVIIHLVNAAPWRAAIEGGAWIALLLGIAALAYGILKRDTSARYASVILLLSGIALIRGAAGWFFVAIAIAAAIWCLPRLIRWISDFRKPAVAATALAIAAFTFTPSTHGQPASGFKAAESIIQTWEISNQRLQGNITFSVRARTGDRFLLLTEPAVLGEINAPGLRVVKSPGDGKMLYLLVAEQDGQLQGTAKFEMPVPNPAAGWHDPAGPAALRRINLRWDQPGWEFTCVEAARVTPSEDPSPNSSEAQIVLGPISPARIQATPRQRDATTEESRFFAEVSNLFIPGPGVVNGRHRVSLRPAQGRVSSVSLIVPDGFTVGDVGDGPVGSWRFDPASKTLRVELESAQEQAFAFTIATQRGAGALPIDLTLQPMRVTAAAGEVGMLGLAFGEDAQPESIDVNGLSRVNPGDFDANLIPKNAEGQPLVQLQHAFRYGSGEVSAVVKVAPVAPELRCDSSMLISLGEDRLVVSSDLNVTISRSGVFRLVLEIPDGLEIESATGESLSHWTESRSDEKRLVTLHLTGRTIGARTFQLTLTGPPTGALPNWSLPRIVLREATRETGTLTIAPERGLQVRAVERRNVSQIDPRELADRKDASSRAAALPGALAFRLLQSDWSLGLAISRLDPWVTARILHEVTLREGQVLNRVHIATKIENAAIKSLRIRIPGLDADAAATVRATGPAVADLVSVTGEEGLFEIRFQRGVAGETPIDIEYQRRGGTDGTESIPTLSSDQLRQISYFASLRVSGRLELEAPTTPRGWQRADWSLVQATIGQPAAGPAPAIAFRVADPEAPLTIRLKRHDLANLRKLRVANGTLTSLFSPNGHALTAVNLNLEVTAKGTLRLTLPADSKLFNVLVNDEGAPLVREGGDWLFHVFPAPETGKPSTVRFVYSSPASNGKLQGPKLNAPMENLVWRVLVPDGWQLDSHSGDFDLKQQQSLGSFRIEDYQTFVAQKRQRDAQTAVALLDQANQWLKAGDQEKAGVALGNASRNNFLDVASNEDARVQLRQLKTQQAVLGLNTRRQRLFLDNRAEAPGIENEQLERAAQVNPVLQGGYNYDPRQFNRFLEGNTADENAALKEIANRMVTQQLAAEPAPATLDINLPENGTVLTFHRSVQIDGEQAMDLTLDLKRPNTHRIIIAVLLCFAAASLAGIRRWKKPAHAE
jgi:hypothetical protein